MRVPTIDRGAGAASPWGRRRPSDEEIRLVPLSMPLAGLVLKGTLLTILTLGLYRFWYRTRLRRYYWSNTTLLGDGFEYTGTGKELLIGFLIALAIVVPLNFLASLIGLFAGEAAGGMISAIAAATILAAFIQIAIYRARGYRLSRTRYRGIRFHQTGTGRAFLATTAKWLLFTVFTLGIMLPYLREAMHRYKIENTHFGSLRASCGSAPAVLMKKWLMVWGSAIVLLVGGGLAAIPFALMLAGSSTPETVVVFSGFLLFFWGPLGMLGVLGLVVLWQIYRLHEFRHFVSTTRFGALALSSDASARTVIWITVKFLLMLGFVYLSLFFLLGGGAAFLSVFDDGEAVGNAIESLGLTIFILPLLFVLIYALMAEIFLRRPLWRHYAGSISLTNTDELAQIIQSEGREGGAFGDSFDTGFDFAG